ncbi:MAG: hypothetical protein EOM92_13235 [Gammaproteobacteria bacterium]|jgi:hypothetical protein|nr:hypothetical protein [Gammaproteobacteria bacterium]
MIEASTYDQARKRISALGFTPDIQTKITLLLSTAKSGNLMFHAGVQWLPRLDLIHQAMLTQYSRELEALTLLSRTTQWSLNPALAIRGGQILAPLTLAWGQVMLPPGPLLNPQAAYRGISLGHAQLARIRLAPVIPDQVDPLNPFIVALQRIELENGRLLQTQIRLLKDMPTSVPLADREARVLADQQLVDGVFNDFLHWLASD